MNLRTLTLALVVLAVTLGVAACNGDGDGGDELENEASVREIIRESIVDEPELHRFICNALAELSNEQAAQAYARAFTGGMPVDRDLGEDQRLMQIQREECEVAFGS